MINATGDEATANPLCRSKLRMVSALENFQKKISKKICGRVYFYQAGDKVYDI